MKNFGEALTTEELMLMMQIADKNKDGRIDYFGMVHKINEQILNHFSIGIIQFV